MPNHTPQRPQTAVQAPHKGRTPAKHAFEQWGYLMAREDFAGAREALKKAKGGGR